MAYVKPGVEISQIETSVTPVLIAPDLEACVIGAAYHWQDPTLDDSEWATEYVPADGSLTIALSGYGSTWYDLTTNDNELVIVDVYVTSGTYAGYYYHYDSTDSNITVATNEIVITSGLSLPKELIGTDADVEIPRAKIKIGYRARKTDIARLQNIERTSDIVTKLGSIVSWNPAAYGAYLAMVNAGKSINAYAVSGISQASDYQDGIDDLEPHEIYAIAIMENSLDLSDELQTHVDAQSEATIKHERIAIFNKSISNATYRTAGVDKSAISEEIKAQNFAYADKRCYSVHPDIAYITETRHILTLDPTWIDNSFEEFCGNSFFSSRNCYAKYASDLTLTDGTKFWKNDNITSANVTTMLHNGIHELTVKVPVPGFYYCAVIAGQIAGEDPSQPLTNMSTAGLSETYGSQDYFSEANLNTMAEGGTYIMTQPTPTAPLTSRHQMSTDVSSIAKRELSAVKALDFVSKFMRNGLRPYIGKYAITPAFLRMLGTILTGMGRYLVREGHINDFRVLNVLQDPAAPDTILVEINVLVKYPANYIKIQLLF